MAESNLKVEVELSAGQHAALSKLAKEEGCELSHLLVRGADMFVASYGGEVGNTKLEKKLDVMHDHTVKLMVTLLKYAGQILYFSTLPLRKGPVQGKLNDEGYMRCWVESEKYAIDLLSPPQSDKGQKVESASGKS